MISFFLEAKLLLNFSIDVKNITQTFHLDWRFNEIPFFQLFCYIMEEFSTLLEVWTAEGKLTFHFG